MLLSVLNGFSDWLYNEWLYRTSEDELPTIILYGYTPTRVGDNAGEFLTGFHGYLATDGYQGYNKVPDIKRCYCWAHVRRSCSTRSFVL